MHFIFTRPIFIITSSHSNGSCYYNVGCKKCAVKIHSPVKHFMTLHASWRRLLGQQWHDGFWYDDWYDTNQYQYSNRYDRFHFLILRIPWIPTKMALQNSFEEISKIILERILFEYQEHRMHKISLQNINLYNLIHNWTKWKRNLFYEIVDESVMP